MIAKRRRVAVTPALAALALGGAVAAVAGCGGGSSAPAGASTIRGGGGYGKVATGASPTTCGTYSGRGCAAPSSRVDTQAPSFSHSTDITNPLFPIGTLRSAVLLGRVDGRPFRSETTLLPGTATVVWNGRRIPVRLSQYMAFADGRLEEVALDRYAQADDGSVWYLGEDVFDYRKGTVAVTEGTWLAGRDGPPAMIMPAKPKVGDVFRTENVPGVVFEEVTVKAVDKTVPGPRGPVPGAILADELHLDGARSPKTFAPGYGEFLTVDGRNREALALAAPADALPGPMPASLSSLTTAAFGILENARRRDWEAASTTVRRMTVAWMALRPRAPRLIGPLLDEKLRALTRAVMARRAGVIAQLAIDVARLALDLELRHRPASEVDVERVHLWTQQLRVDAAAGNLAGVTGDVAVVEWLRDRVMAALDRGGLERFDAELRGLRSASDAKDLPASADHAARLGALLRRFAVGGRGG